MFFDPRLEKLANLMVNYSLEVKEGDLCQIKGSALAHPLIQVLYKHILLAGGRPFCNVRLPGLSEIFFKTASEKQLGTINEFEYFIVNQISKSITILGGENSRELTNVDAGKQTLHKKGAEKLVRRFNERWTAGELQFLVTCFPTYSHAQDADMSLNEFEELFFNSCYIDCDDPVAEFKKLSRKNQKLIDFLQNKKMISIQGPGTAITLSIAGRKLINSDGKYNMPDGEVYTTPIENSANGHMSFTYPLCYAGREVEQVTMKFKDGKIIEAKAAKGEEFLNKMLDIDAGARFLGEFAIATNDRVKTYTKDALFDEKMGGTVHIAAGYGFPYAGGSISSSLHWDMICDLRQNSEIRADGELFFKDGKFTLSL
jgi:aminopeptidase